MEGPGQSSLLDGRTHGNGEEILASGQWWVVQFSTSHILNAPHPHPMPPAQLWGRGPTWAIPMEV